MAHRPRTNLSDHARRWGRSRGAGPLRSALAGLFVLLHASAAQAQSDEVTIAFIGDQGLGGDAVAVLELIRDEDADAVLHQGDFDYEDDPAAWDAMISDVLGANFPYFASVGNHDDSAFNGPGGYQELLAARMNRLGIPWNGDLGVKSSHHFQGIFIVLTAPGVFGNGDREYAPFIRDALASDGSIWSISSWHKNMNAMQVGGKSDETGWGVYEESRRGGAIIATAHEHSYSRTHLMASLEDQIVASTDQPLVLSEDNPATAADEGRSFVFVSGLGGRSIRDQEQGGDWWASIYTADQGARFGALFGVFNFQGDPHRAFFYFKDIDGNVVDEFLVESAVGEGGGAPPPLPPPPSVQCDDSLDNDGDGDIDFPNDLGCQDFSDDSEASEGTGAPTEPDEPTEPEEDGDAASPDQIAAALERLEHRIQRLAERQARISEKLATDPHEDRRTGATRQQEGIAARLEALEAEREALQAELDGAGG